jgi:hypothetical protein
MTVNRAFVRSWPRCRESWAEPSSAGRGERLHLVADSELHDFSPSWVLCDCGVRVDGRNAAKAASAFARHRSEAGATLAKATGWQRTLLARS